MIYKLINTVKWITFFISDFSCDEVTSSDWTDFFSGDADSSFSTGSTVKTAPSTGSVVLDTSWSSSSLISNTICSALTSSLTPVAPSISSSLSFFSSSSSTWERPITQDKKIYIFFYDFMFVRYI